MREAAICLSLILALNSCGTAAAPAAASDAQPTADSSDASPTSDAAADATVGLQGTVGKNIDEQQTRTLKGTWQLPPEFYAALDAQSVLPEDLSFPDNGLIFEQDSTRLHWTDRVRHAGTLAPDLATMAAADVAAALAQTDPAVSARELLVAQGMYGQREDFVVSRFDEAITVATDGQPLLAALEAFYKHVGVEGAKPLSTTWADVKDDAAAQAAKFSLPTQIALAQCIQGLMRAAELRDGALTIKGKLGLTDWAKKKGEYWNQRGSVDGYVLARTLGEAMDFELLSRAGQIAMRSVESARVALAKEPLAVGAELDLVGPLGRIALSMDPTASVWTGGDFFLLVDGGGDDTYLGDTASNLDFFHPVSAVLDLAGNDQYKPSKFFDIQKGILPSPTSKGARQGAGIFGIAVLIDAKGDDSYQGVHFTQGSAMFGVGVLIDRGGKDQYRGYATSQGSAEFGYALLLDTGNGDDHYETLQTSQGYGATRGIGWLVDDGGNDSYLAIETPIVADWASEGTNWSGSQGFGFGLRIFPQGSAPGVYLSGGMGGLFDLGGDDKYQCAVMCQGFGYFFGTGILYDKAGNDEHIVTHKYGIGGATHQSIGIFMDLSGKDSYTYAGHGKTGGGEGIGLGYDFGVAFHLDLGKGGDTYDFPVDIGGIMGFARHPALGVLINEGGDDTYHITGAAADRALGISEVYDTDRSVQGGTANTPSFGMFLDLGGKNDVYDLKHAGVQNGATWIQNSAVGSGWMAALDHGYGLDSE